MKTNKFLAVSLMATMILTSCSNNEDSAVVDSTKSEILMTAGIGTVTRAVINPDYENDLPVAFARMNPGVPGNTWDYPDLKAVRVGGSGATPIVFETGQEYPASGNVSLFGYYPRPAATPTTTTNKLVADYSITGDEDIMATDFLSGSTATRITTCTFKHLLAQLQFRLVGSDGARGKWGNGDGTGISVAIKNVPRSLQLTLTKSGAGGTAVLTTTTGTPDNGDLTVHGVPVMTNPDDQNPTLGYCMLFPTPGMGTVTIPSAPVVVEVTANYDGTPTTRPINIENIAGGLQAGVSNLITLVFTTTGEITASSTIAPWAPGNNGSGVVTPN